MRRPFEKTRLILLILFFIGFTTGSLALSMRSARAGTDSCDVCYLVAAAAHKIWLQQVFFKDNLLRAMMMLTEQMNAVAMHQMFIFGTFLDAKHQLETQRLFQELKAEAHRDYQPSEDFCWFGTNTRSLSASEHTGDFNARALNTMEMARHLGNVNVAGALTRDQDKEARWQIFRKRHCDPQDNNWEPKFPAETGLADVCSITNNLAGSLANIDIDYTRLIDMPRSLNVAFYNDAAFYKSVPSLLAIPVIGAEPDEEDILALGKNLYGHDVLTRRILADHLKNKEAQHLYMSLRTVAAARNVAENSYNHIVGLKSYGASDDPDKDYSPTGDVETPLTHTFLAAILAELGADDEEIFQMIGLRPSYYAQMEILAKKIYQNPTFYARLQDKPVNVARKGAALQALDLMLGRDMYESQLRREMILSVLLSTRLRERDMNVQSQLPSSGG